MTCTHSLLIQVPFLKPPFIRPAGLPTELAFMTNPRLRLLCPAAAPSLPSRPAHSSSFAQILSRRPWKGQKPPWLGHVQIPTPHPFQGWEKLGLLFVKAAGLW